MKITLFKTAVLSIFAMALVSMPSSIATNVYASGVEEIPGNTGVMVARNACNPCNPCGKGANPCNPCGKGANPCNPCGKGANPCNPCNPCAGKLVVQLRSVQQPCVKTLVKQGEKFWNNEELGESGFSCMTCHEDYELLTNRPWPHYIKMAKDVFTLDQMINFCLLNPIDGKKIDPLSIQMTAAGAFYQVYMKNWVPTEKPAKGGPCSPCNPCGGKMMNPCGKGMKNPCGGMMMNPCGKGMMNPCNPCGR
jgi:hypothetical protein